MTAYAVEALATERAMRQQVDAALQLAKTFVLRCQQPDGGFAFTCEPASLNNKAAYRDEKLTQARSYGTATCDAIRALMACGLKPTDEPAARGLTWISKHTELEVVPGFEGLPREAGWQRGSRFYYYASLASVLKHFPDHEIRQDGPAEAPHETASPPTALGKMNPTACVRTTR